jgi:SHS2 domain-containing protein
MGGEADRAGFELLPHTADVMISSWGSTVEDCLGAAVRGLVSSFADVRAAEEQRTVSFACDPGGEPELLARLLEEVVFVVDAYDVVPVRVSMARTGDGGLAGEFGMVERGAVTVVGPAPKAVTRHGLRCDRVDSTWRCQVVIDV